MLIHSRSKAGLLYIVLVHCRKGIGVELKSEENVRKKTYQKIVFNGK